MASNSSRSISTAPAGKVTPSRRYLSAPQSNSRNSSVRLVGAQTAFKTFTASGVTSAPMPSPGMTAMRAFAPPFRMGMPGKVNLLNGCELLKEISQLIWLAILSLKRNSRQCPPRLTVESPRAERSLFQLGEFRPGSLKDGKVRVSRFPKVEESLIG